MSFRGFAPSRGRAQTVSGYLGVIALRWLGIAILIVSALTTPLPAWLPGSIGVAMVAAGYNLAAMVMQGRGGVPRRVRAPCSALISSAAWWRC